MDASSASSGRVRMTSALPSNTTVALMARLAHSIATSVMKEVVLQWLGDEKGIDLSALALSTMKKSLDLGIPSILP
ncbi:hypothetical protein CVT24_002098 [Panaeolus cyanescens]|uniref:Uncharacterized protein n=1 Tax=Panaeolus cyanescens TaxID=181874 RepID=A0A409WJE4_9AGAR|nr:hypothetical protein CVT24_002098 [Panaeolus cyanescens]